MVKLNYYENSNVLIPYKNIQHVEKLFRQVGTKKVENGLWIITGETKWSQNEDGWENPCYVHQDFASDFLGEYKTYVNDETR